MRKPKVVKKIGVKVDLSGWELGQWPDEIEKIIRIEVDRDKVTLGFHPDSIEGAARNIATDAIEAFFEEGFFLTPTEEGLQASDEGGDAIGMIPWSTLYVMERGAARWLVNFLDQRTDLSSGGL